ncbi:MAG: M14 family metallopeptidase [Erythrobacter sp.]|uniref:M14 family metallopeptidase n=1 Tax=Erythrobacter sp. TaxID=1042 RepID=UPI0026022322|nr:M14 family metallopeptidase [Erythrobacter sp.]MDJ0977106.1 M14 family metallopeptidase [Erythrobacter sp.]
MTSLRVTSSIPDGLLEASARDLHQILDGPTLIELEGKPGAPLFVSALMHGNEDSGLVAIQKVLRAAASRALPRPLMILIGNVSAARDGVRRLEGQPDYNRVWPGCVDHKSSAEARVMAQVHSRVIERNAFAAIDIHNNTGRNPHYGVICVEDERVMTLASLFASRAVLFRGLPGTQTASFRDLIPALTVECGQSGVEANAEAAARLVQTVLSLQNLEARRDAEPITLFHTLAQVRVRSDVALKRASNRPWLALNDDLDLHNFERLHRDFNFGLTNDPMPFEVIDENGDDVAGAFFQSDDGRLTLSRSVVPAMLTTQERVIRQDCLCYLMEELHSDT